MNNGCHVWSRGSELTGWSDVGINTECIPLRKSTFDDGGHGGDAVVGVAVGGAVGGPEFGQGPLAVTIAEHFPQTTLLESTDVVMGDKYVVGTLSKNCRA